MSKNKNLLNENTIRRMMKLASVDALSDSFISTKYTPLAESTEEQSVEEAMHGGNKGDKSKTRKGDKDYTAKKEEPGEDKRKGAEKRGAEGTLAKTKGHGRVDYANEEVVNEDEVVVTEDEEEERELDATEDELSDMDSEADRERDELEADDEAMEDEVTLTDDEAREIIALADKLRAAMGGEEEEEAGEEMSMDMDAGGEEMEMDAEVEEEPGMRYDMMEEEENLYEAALSGLDIEIVEEKETQLENLKKEIYKKVVNRLLNESKK
jgi:hypothetical protein